MTVNPSAVFAITVEKDSYEPYTLVLTRGESSKALGPFDRYELRQLVHAAMRQLNAAEMEETVAQAQHQPPEEAS